ncbi:type I restriction-modification system subunit M [Paenarthrobacter sp. NPDC056912]|uniref:type I restriction-modification system subunit M n=1 Tax=Paenarthrobacter sp. NPDC056912 TaxID=3345965 RepID=UPI00366B615F
MTTSTESASKQGVRAVALKKSDLYSSLWKSCDELRGGMDASQYKDYILTMLFVKYVSDKAKTDPNSLIDVPVGGSFDDMVAVKGDKEIGDKVNKIIAKLAEVNDLQKVIDLADFNDEEKLGKGKEMQDRLSKLVTIFQELDFRGSRAEGDDLLGDAYEYLMRHFATESGKSKGQFYTPAEVSRVIAQLISVNPDTPRSATVYDPTCGSGSLLLKVAAESRHGMSIYGQEKDNATWALSKMNMILHDNAIADIRKGDTITSPQFTNGDRLDTFDFIVANPPFSIKSWSNGLENEFGRFEYGMPPEKNGDYAFLLHILKSMKSTGKAAVILPHGVLFRGNKEADIRKQLLKRGFIKGIIGLPANLFYGTGIPACIIVLDKENAQGRSGVFMIDASKGFLKEGNKNRLRSQDMHKIVDIFTKQQEVERYSRMVPLSEIGSDANDFNLNIPRYIDSTEPEDIQDLYAHLHGGIPNRDIDALSASWDAFPSLRQQLFKSAGRDGYSKLTVDIRDVHQAILGSEEFAGFSDNAYVELATWYAAHHAALESIDENTRPNDLIAELGDDLLVRFRSKALLDEYDVYEKLMTYWHSTMHDDVFLVMNEGWLNAAKPRKAIEDKDRKISETPDLVVGAGRSATKYKMDLIPPALIVNRYFTKEQADIDQLTAVADDAARQIDEYIEEHSGDEGLLADAMDDGKISKALAATRLKESKREHGDPEEIEALEHLTKLYNGEAAARKLTKDAQSKLDSTVLVQYGKLTKRDVKELVLYTKWQPAIAGGIDGEITKLAHNLVARIKELGERYDETVHDLETEFERLNVRVAQHLAAMGVE